MAFVASNDKKVVHIGNYMMTKRVLGKGHFARVEEAVHSVLNIKVAIKIIDLSKTSDPYVARNLKREALIMAKLNHPGIIALFETKASEKHYYIITELGTGGDLCSFIKSQQGRKLDEKKGRSFAMQIASAVQHLHDRGVVHRDLKMENILLDQRKENIKIADFGLSNNYSPDDPLRTHCGSPEYAAPELFISGYRYGPEVDIWSLGVVFYAMMNGKLPFSLTQKTSVTPEERRKQLINEINEGIAAKQQKTLLTCSNLFRNLILKMLEPNPRKRLSISQVKIHAWIFSTSSIDFMNPDQEWITSTVNKMARESIYTTGEIMVQIQKNPYGTLGGIYNIRKYQYQISKYNLAHSLAKIRSVANHSSHQAKRPVTVESDDPTNLFLNRTFICSRPGECGKSDQTDGADRGGGGGGGPDKNFKFSIDLPRPQNPKNKIAFIKQVYMNSSRQNEAAPTPTSVSVGKSHIRSSVTTSKPPELPNAKSNQIKKVRKISTTSIKGIFRKNILKPIPKSVSIAQKREQQSRFHHSSSERQSQSQVVPSPKQQTQLVPTLQQQLQSDTICKIQSNVTTGRSAATNAIAGSVTTQSQKVSQVLVKPKRKESDLKSSYDNFRQKFGSGMPVHTAARAAYRNRNTNAESSSRSGRNYKQPPNTVPKPSTNSCSQRNTKTLLKNCV